MDHLTVANDDARHDSTIRRKIKRKSNHKVSTYTRLPSLGQKSYFLPQLLLVIAIFDKIS